MVELNSEICDKLSEILNTTENFLTVWATISSSGYIVHHGWTAMDIDVSPNQLVVILSVPVLFHVADDA